MIYEELLAANERYADSFTSPVENGRPVRKLAVLTCMDARIVPHALLGADLGDMNVIRNGGARATPDAIRSLMLSNRLLGTRHVAVIHHTDCGNSGTDEELRAKVVETGLPEDAVPMPLYANHDSEGAVIEDVRRLRETPLLADGVTVEGYLYDVDTGRLRHIEVD